MIPINAQRYTVECQEYLAAQYVDYDIKKLDDIAKRKWRETVLELKDDEGLYSTDEMMLIMALMVHRLGSDIDANRDKTVNKLGDPQTWAVDAFPEFCSLIGPNSGFGKKPLND